MTDLASRRRIEWAAFAAVLLVAAALRLVRLDDNGFGTAYYAAGVRSERPPRTIFGLATGVIRSPKRRTACSGAEASGR